MITKIFSICVLIFTAILCAIALLLVGRMVFVPLRVIYEWLAYAPEFSIIFILIAVWVGIKRAIFNKNSNF